MCWPTYTENMAFFFVVECYLEEICNTAASCN